MRFTLFRKVAFLLVVFALAGALTASVTIIVTNIARGSAANHSLFLRSDGSLWGMGVGVNGNNPVSAFLQPQEFVASGFTSIAVGGCDNLNRLTNQAWNLHTTPLASYVYTLGPTGNRTALAETVSGTPRSYTWAYDYLYRLTGESIGTNSVSYHYDAVGNRTNRTSTLTGVNFQSNNFTANDWLASDGYDASGNTTSSSAITYQYDALNHLTNAGNGSILIAYDGDGNRVRKTVGGTTTYYLLDDGNPSGYVQVLEEWTTVSDATNLSRVYNYGLDLVSQRQVSGGTVSYYGHDGHGSKRFLANTAGTITDTYTFDAGGLIITDSGTTPNNYLYAGQQWDPDLGLYYNRARYLNPNSGRFWTMDTDQGDNQNPLSLQKYVYTEADPIL